MKPIHRLPRRRHYIRSMALAASIVTMALAIGVNGFHFLNGDPWLDALANASLLLGGMGLTTPLTSAASKLFASFYALMSGLALISTAAILLAPWVHRLLHKLHADEPDTK